MAFPCKLETLFPDPFRDLGAEELGEQAELTDWRFRWDIAQARIKEVQGDYQTALDLLQGAELLFFQTAIFLDATFGRYLKALQEKLSQT